MTQTEVPFTGNDRIREAEISDLAGSEPPRKSSPIQSRDQLLSESEPKVPEEIREAARERSIAKQIREEYGGSGFAIVDKRSGEVVGIAVDLREARSIIKSRGLLTNDSLIVSCYER